MRILQLHVDNFLYKPISKEIDDAEEAEEKEVRFEELVVALVSVESGDDRDVVSSAAEEIADSMKVISAGSLLIYPYSHLSSDLASPVDAIPLMKELEDECRKKGLNVSRAPFGWNKSFALKLKGHPLAEQAKTFHRKEKKQGTEPKEKFKSFFIIDVDGTEEELDPRDLSLSRILNKKKERYSLLKTFVTNEIIGKESKKQEPSHIRLMRRLELVDYCPESDIGNLKWYPNGALIKDLIVDYALNNVAIRLGAMKMQNPILYRTELEEIRELQGEFHERDYTVKEENSSLVLRFASDPGAFPFAQKLNPSYKSMPIRLYEEAICFRKEQSGEVSGLMRVRNFWMTDMHSFLGDEAQAKNEFELLTLTFAKLMDEIISADYWVLGFEAVEEYYTRYKKFFSEIVKKVKVPAFIKLMREMTHYYAFKNEFQGVFSDGDNLQISTVQWDVKNGERFHIEFTDAKGRKQPVPFIIHASSFGSVERALGAILESAVWRESKGALPVLPVWLSPEQVRVIPVSAERHLEEAKKIAEEIEEESIRVGLDDRDLGMGKKVYDARTSWIPYVIVIGDKEVKSRRLSVSIRWESSLKQEHREEMTVTALISRIKKETRGMPFRRTYIPRELSRRIAFVS